ncbi:tryptophan transporter [Calidifontibacillus erzurumensis]|uniref:Tryptophan transporter n=1 Tax=Calidifontibacillus erzurumensis TaxID=2741433 RepID=A0A8J8GER6_9BACI|nr:tryptophan transporter [Calidifontibacillus erzurumensis]NSL52002.1 tryptophan transporter [Calidifontibacillus erzurumensis]
MNTKVLVSLAMLVGIGAVLHAVVPPILFGMKPDMLLTMMFLGIMLFPNIKNVIVLAIGTGIVSALTTGFPGGQIANMIDKPITALIFFGLFLAIRKFNQSVVSAAVLTAIGTIISGTVFLGSALILFGLPGGASFTALFTTVVLPAGAVNTIVMIVIYPIVQAILKRSKITAPESNSFKG